MLADGGVVVMVELGLDALKKNDVVFMVIGVEIRLVENDVV